MYQTIQKLQKDYMVACCFEKQRKHWVDNYQYKKALLSYKLQKVFLPDSNSGIFWDEKFEQQRKLNPMENWRANIVISNLKNEKNLLNIGVGSGRFEEKLFLKYQNIKYIGTDITQKTLKRLSNKFPNHIFKFQKLPFLDFDNLYFDQIILLEVLEHIKPSQTFQLLGEIFRVLKNDGIFILSVPINEGLERILPDNPNSHMRIYNKQLVEFEVQKIGFRIIKEFEAPAYDSFFKIKYFINKIFNFSSSNNIILICQK